MGRGMERRVVVPVGPDDETAGQSDATAAPDGLAAIGRLTDDLLPTLITRVGASGLGELEVRQDGWRIRLRRSPGKQHDGDVAGRAARQRTAERRHDRNPDLPGTTLPDGSAAHRDSAAHGAPDRGVVSAPAVGYYQPRPDLSPGMTLRGGDVIGHVDVLGVSVEVVSVEDGRLSRLLAEAGEAVEFGQPLARLETESRH